MSTSAEFRLSITLLLMEERGPQKWTPATDASVLNALSLPEKLQREHFRVRVHDHVMFIPLPLVPLWQAETLPSVHGYRLHPLLPPSWDVTHQLNCTMAAVVFKCDNARAYGRCTLLDTLNADLWETRTSVSEVLSLLKKG